MPEYIHPFKARHVITSGYGLRIHPITQKSQFHGGIDYRALVGEEVVAICDGIIIRVWTDDINGNALRLLHGDSVRVGYAHLNDVCVKVGDVVKQSDIIAHSGNSGRSSGPHLHLGIYFAIGWETHNPVDFLDAEA